MGWIKSMTDGILWPQVGGHRSLPAPPVSMRLTVGYFSLSVSAGLKKGELRQRGFQEEFPVLTS